MELVQSSQVIEQRLQGLGDGEELQEAVNDDVEDGQEAQADVAEVDGQILRLQLHWRVDLVGQALKVQFLRVFLQKMKRKCLLITFFPRMEISSVSIHFYLVVIHVLVVPVALQPVLGSVLLDKVVDAVPEVVGLQ